MTLVFVILMILNYNVEHWMSWLIDGSNFGCVHTQQFLMIITSLAILPVSGFICVVPLV